MGQYDILEYLKGQPNKWFTAEELQPLFESNTHNIVRCCSKLAQSGMISYRIVTNHRNKYEFSTKK